MSPHNFVIQKGFNFNNYYKTESPQKNEHQQLGSSSQGRKLTNGYTAQNFNQQYSSLDQGKKSDKMQDSIGERISSRETMFRFYDKDSKGKRMVTPGYAGVESYRVYYQKYKNMDRELEENSEGYSASTAYLNKVRSLKVLPSPIGLIHHKNKEGTIKGNNLKMGQNYALALSSSLKYFQNTQTINLSGNRLGDKGAAAILSNLVDRVRNIYLDNNKIGQEGMAKLVTWINTLNNRCQLEELSLEGNNINCQMTVDLVDAIINAMPPLTNLNLSRNNIGDKGGQALGELFSSHQHLKVVKISWNKIRGKGGIAIAEGLKENRQIAFLDASFNQFGNLRNGEFGAKMGETVNRGVLRHLDISYNSMNKHECEIFGETIRENHTLWGLHMMGNDCLVDSMGFVRPGLKSTIQSRDILNIPSLDGNNLLNQVNSTKTQKIMSYKMCWICEGWSEKRFEWKSGISGHHFKEPVYIHFDFDEYRPWLMVKGYEEFYIWKMIPPGKSHYFFSFGGQGGEAEAARDQPHAKTQTLKHIRDVPFEEIDGKTNQKVIFTQSFQLRSINYVFGKQQKILDNDYDPIQFQAIVPRLSDKQWLRVFVIRPRTPWSVPISLFKDYALDTEESLDAMFEYDWNCMKLPILTEDEAIEIKSELRKAYRVIKETYRMLSAFGGNGSVFSISLNTYTDFVKTIGLLDGKIINTTTSDTEFLSINKRTKHSTLNPGVALVRFQFMEILMRIALKRYENASSKGEAIRMMTEKNLMPVYGNLNPQKWRDEHLWKEEVDNFFKSHFPIFDQLFKKWGCNYLRPGDKPFMMADEFNAIFYNCNLISDQLINREVAISFALSIQPQIDELNKERHLRATFAEFLEAFARASDKLSLPPQIDEESGDVPLTDQERVDQSLVQKLENILPIVYEVCMTNQFKERWKQPTRDPETGLFKDRYFSHQRTRGTRIVEMTTPANNAIYPIISEDEFTFSGSPSRMNIQEEIFENYEIA